MSNEPDYLPRRLWWLLAGLTLAWGFNWTAMKVALSEVQPWTFRSLGLGAGAVILFLALRALGQPVAWPRGQWGRLTLLAFFNITCWNVLVAFGLQMVPSGRASILAFTMPVLAIPLSVWLLGERVGTRKVAGFVLGMVGLALLLGNGIVDAWTVPVGSLLILGAAVCGAIGLVLQKRYPVAMPAASYTVWIMLLGGVPIFVCTLVFEGLDGLQGVSLWPALGVAYNVLIGFSWAYWAWIKLATSVPVTVFSLSLLVIPVVGVTSGMLLLGERPNWTDYAALLLVLGSLLTVLIAPRRVRM